MIICYNIYFMSTERKISEKLYFSKFKWNQGSVERPRARIVILILNVIYGHTKLSLSASMHARHFLELPAYASLIIVDWLFILLPSLVLSYSQKAEMTSSRYVGITHSLS